MSGKKEDSNVDWLKTSISNLTKGSAMKQVGVGGAGGMVTGYVCSRVGKAAAAALGGSIVLMQVAHHLGYVNINWSKLEKNYNEAKNRVEKDADKVIPGAVAEVRRFVSENVILASSFSGGFLLGLSI